MTTIVLNFPIYDTLWTFLVHRASLIFFSQECQQAARSDKIDLPGREIDPRDFTAIRASAISGVPTMIQHAIASIAQLENQLQLGENLASLKTQMLAAKKLSELHALIIHYSHQELNQAYNLLTQEQKCQIDAICERDSLV